MSTSVRGAILKYLHTLIVFTILFYIQFTFKRVSLQTYGPATELCSLKKQLDSSAEGRLSGKNHVPTKALKKNLLVLP